MMVSFSTKHKLHFLLPPTYGRALEAMAQFKLCWILLSFNSQMCLKEFSAFFFTFFSRICYVIVITLFKVHLASSMIIFSFVSV